MELEEMESELDIIMGGDFNARTEVMGAGMELSSEVKKEEEEREREKESQKTKK